jgi:hypothetical protein
MPEIAWYEIRSPTITAGLLCAIHEILRLHTGMQNATRTLEYHGPPITTWPLMETAGACRPDQYQKNRLLVKCPEHIKRRPNSQNYLMCARVLNKDTTSTGPAHACRAFKFWPAISHFKPGRVRSVEISYTVGPACQARVSWDRHSY